MNKNRAILMAQIAHKECLKHKDCSECPFDVSIACGFGCAIDFITDKKLPEGIFQSGPFEPEQAKEITCNPGNCIGSRQDIHDNVNSPNHYCKGGLECIDAIRAAVSDLQGIEAVYAGNVIKYVWRFKGKNGLEDLKKAEHYLHWLIEEVEKNG